MSIKQDEKRILQKGNIYYIRFTRGLNALTIFAKQIPMIISNKDNTLVKKLLVL